MNVMSTGMQDCAVFLEMDGAGCFRRFGFFGPPEPCESHEWLGGAGEARRWWASRTQLLDFICFDTQDDVDGWGGIDAVLIMVMRIRSCLREEGIAISLDGCIMDWQVESWVPDGRRRIVSLLLCIALESIDIE
jgi:hypothetical protein